MVHHRISIEPAPMQQKQKEQAAVVKQNAKFAVIAKKRNWNKRPGQQNSLVPVPDNASDSDDEPQEQAHAVIMV